MPIGSCGIRAIDAPLQFTLDQDLDGLVGIAAHRGILLSMVMLMSG
jgi:hypothetical protein